MTAISVGILASADLSFPLTSPLVAVVQEPNAFDSDTPPNIGDGRRSLIPDNLDQLKLAELKAIARQFHLMTHVVEIGPLNQKASYIKTLEAYRHQHQYEAANASSSECDRFFESDVNDYPEPVELADRLHSSNEPILMRSGDEPELQAIESTGEFRCTVGDCIIREVAGIAYLDAPSGSYQFKAGLGECAIALSTTPETLSQIIAHLQKFNRRTSFPTTFAQAVFAIEQQSQPPTPMMDWAQKLNQAFAGASAIGIAIALSATPIISVFTVLNVAMDKVPKMQLLALSYCQKHPNDSSVQAQPRWHSWLNFFTPFVSYFWR